jgi:hypothetical protein
VAAEQSTESVFAVDVAHRPDDTEPVACVLCKLGIGGLEEDLDAVERTDDCFGLHERSVGDGGDGHELTYRTSCESSCEASAEDVVETPLVEGLLVFKFMCLYCYRRIVGVEELRSWGSSWGRLLEHSRRNSAGVHLGWLCGL